MPWLPPPLGAQSLCAQEAGPAASSQPLTAHVDAAERLITDLDPADNEYSYKDPFIKWKGDPGVDQPAARCDCSAFLSMLLEHAYGFSPDQMKRWMGRRLPVARIWHDQVEAGKGFTRIDRVDQIRRGDIIAVKYLRNPDDPNAPKDTGHVMVVTETPRPHTESTPVIPNTTQWEVVIIDSSKSAHGPTDTRRSKSGGSGASSANTGVGKGTLRLYADTATGQIAGYTWSILAVSKFEPPDQHHVVVGRLKPDLTMVQR